ncbi:MAG: peptide chain release factor aRF-1 [Nanoarchaeota archaeon]|nr:peptide chain release factor aRF-1 [Nanoarchaeota archaeon]
MISKDELEELIEELEKIKGRHTELVSVYVPAGLNKNVVSKQIESEKGTASNIKSKTTMKNVVDALETISRELKLYKNTPENGMAIFCGNVSEKEGQPDLKTWIIEPPKPLKTRLYRCDQVFVLEPLKEMMEVDEVYGLVVMDRKEATLGLLEGKQIKVLRKMTSGVPGKYKTGGQSAARFSRLRDQAAKEFYRRIAGSMKELYFNLKNLKGIIIGGPIPTKEEFVKEGQITASLKDKIIGMKDIGNTDESGLTDLVQASQDLLAEQEIIYEKKILENFFEKLGKNNKVAYKKPDIEKALKYGAVKTLILSKKLKKQDILDFKKKAETTSTEIEIVSTETEEGEQFYNLGGVGALLRFDI